ncbi:MFS transporter [Candidatus Enterococcus ferrettii]|uniref:Major facilitator superfamily (MFS) profile domain-containing protein n=1 Tax=Candidatus Enterococcus ferrettii TaxID=2815324 RepID=A0ABV0EJV6_9ENTE|nr:MFS transporter [Enterococcus sp. 665A]MBO1338218.1 MFS transporter [Enterococcus sp. 665A]
MKNKQLFTLLTMAIGIFLCILDTTVMNIALPAIQTGLHTDLNKLQWALNIYTITFATLTIPLGRLADHFGQNRVYLIGLFVFIVGSMISGASSSVNLLIVGRGIQSIGAAIIFPTSMTIGINTIDIKQRDQAILILGLTQGLAAAFGPTFGGLFTQLWTWRSIFFINVPFAVLSLILCLILLPFKNESRVKTSVDVLGMILSGIILFSLTLALVQGSTWGWLSFSILGLFTTFSISLILFLLHESRCTNPMIQLDLFKHRHFVGSIVVTVISGIFFVAIIVILPSYFTKIQGYSELQAAIMITPATLMVLIFSPFSGLLLKKIGPRLLITTGVLAIIAGYVGMSVSNLTIYWQLAVSISLIGIGYGIIVGPITILSAGNFTGDLLTASQSVTGVFRQIGTVLAVAIFVTALSNNLVTAKRIIWDDAQNSVKKICVSENERKKIATLTYHDIYFSEGSSDNIKQTEKISPQVKKYRLGVKKNVQIQMTNAFIRPYRIATPFTVAFLSSIFIFKRKRYN